MTISHPVSRTSPARARRRGASGAPGDDTAQALPGAPIAPPVTSGPALAISKSNAAHPADDTGPLAAGPTRSTPGAHIPWRERLAISVEEAGAVLGISRDLAYDLVARGELPSVRLGRRIVVPCRALEQTLARALEQADHG